MHLSKKDVIATGLVVAAVVLYLLWVADAAPPGLSATRATGTVILALGFAASAVAVVPSFEQLLHGNRVYLAVTSLLGLVALAGGVVMLVSASEAGLAVVVVAMVAMWAIATTHHTLQAKTEPTVLTARR